MPRGNKGTRLASRASMPRLPLEDAAALDSNVDASDYAATLYEVCASLCVVRHACCAPSAP